MRPEKASVISEVRERIEGSEYMFLTDYTGMTVEQFEDLRGQLRAANSRMDVVKNSFVKLIAGEKEWTSLESALAGSTAMVCGEGDVVAVAKVLSDFAKEHEKATVKAGVMGETPLSPEEVKQLAELPSKEVLYGKLVGTLAAPMSQVVGVMHQKVCSLLYVLKAVEEKKSA